MASDFQSREREFHDFDPSATDDHCRRRHMWPKIRAIHSEEDKEFVRFLGRELGKMCYDVLDADVESNLGGRGCRLVLVVLSQKFLTTEACMTEFMLVMNDPDCLCLFYELSVEEFLHQNNVAKWREVWESWQGIQVRYDEAAWRLRLEVDCSTLADGNTIEFMKIIAQTISSRFIPLQVHWSQQTSCIQGRTRLCRAYAYLDHCLKHSSEKVFLVVDNIQDSWECLERARDLFLRRVPFPNGSMVLCLARSSHTLEQFLLPLDKLCRIESIPSLTPMEGYEIFFDVLLSERDAILWREVIPALSNSSIFIDQQQHTMGAVHPLRFKSLGCFFREKGAEYWISAFAQGRAADAIFEDIINLEEDNALKIVFKALHEIYDCLDRQVQQVFIDIALYIPKRDLSWLWRLDHDKDDFFSSGFECLQKLRAVTLLTIEERKIKMHSLCKKFAEKVARQSETLVYVVGKTVSKADLCIMLDHRADVIQKVSFEDCFFDNGDSLEPFILDLSNCKHIQVLRLLNVTCQHSLQICLGHSKLLTLEISSISTPVIVTGDLSSVRCFSGSLDRVPGSKVPLIENLEVLEINMRKRNSAVGLERGFKRFLTAGHEKFTLQDFWGACELEVLCLTGSHCDYQSRMLPLDGWPRLRELTLFQVGGLEILEGLSNLHYLRTLHVESLTHLVSLDGTELLSRLQQVHVIQCRRLSKLQLPAWLNHCCIWLCDNLQEIAVCGDGSVNLEAPVTRTSEDCDEVDEIRRNYPCPDKEITCSHLVKKSSMLGYSPISFVPFSSESKFSIVACRNLRACNGFAKLTSIKAFEFERCPGISGFQVDSLNATDMAKDGDFLSESNQWASGGATHLVSGSKQWASGEARSNQWESGGATHSVSGSSQWASAGGARSNQGASGSNQWESGGATHSVSGSDQWASAGGGNVQSLFVDEGVDSGITHVVDEQSKDNTKGKGRVSMSTISQLSESSGELSLKRWRDFVDESEDSGITHVVDEQSKDKGTSLNVYHFPAIGK